MSLRLRPGSRRRLRPVGGTARTPLRLGLLAAALSYLVLGGDATREALPRYTLAYSLQDGHGAGGTQQSPHGNPARTAVGFSIDAHAAALTAAEPTLRLSLSMAPPLPAHAGRVAAVAGTVGAAAASTADPPLVGAAAVDAATALASLDTRLIGTRVSSDVAGRDAFSARSWVAPPPPAPPPPPPAEMPPPPPPQAPPLPFRYMGRLEEGGPQTTVYLSQGERLIVAAAGDVIDNTYRLESLEGRLLRFTYLPLNQEQTLAMPAPSQ